MKKMRAIYDRWTESDVQFLSNLGIIVKVGINRFEIEEDDERYVNINLIMNNEIKSSIKLPCKIEPENSIARVNSARINKSVTSKKQNVDDIARVDYAIVDKSKIQ
jgi:hypothetical protein